MTMRPEGNPLDLNNFPEDYGKQVLEESSTTTAASSENSRFKKKKKDGKDESGTIYECRFCSLKFCKSQALGGHMNRHRQERETETLNRARQLVFSNDGITGGGAPMGLRDLSFGSSMQTTQSSCFHQVGNAGDSRLHFGPMYPRVAAPLPQSQHLQPYMYTTLPPPSQSSSYPSAQAPAARPQPLPPVNDYYVGRVLASSPRNQRQSPSYPFFGTSPPAAGPEPPPSRPPMDGGSRNFGHRFFHQGNNYPSSMDRSRDDI